MAIRRRGGKWTVKIYDPKAPGRTRWIGSFETREEAVDAERAASVGIAPSARARTIRDWSMVWLRDYPRPAVSSQRTYRYAVERINADAGDLLLARVDRPTARRLAKEWPTGTTRVARTMFADAHRDGLIVANPFTNLRLETPKGRKDLDALSETEVVELADAAVSALGKYGREFRAILIFLGYVGCRPGELCCIRRADVDHDRAEVTIRFSLDGQGGEKPPKNGRPRVVTVPPPALAALADVPTRLDSPYLLHTTSGRRLSKGMLSYSFRVVRQRWAKREHLELYELRHACATLLMERGLPPHVVANQLGHTDGGALVQRLYGHPSERGMREQIRIAFGEWGADGVQQAQKLPGNRGFRSDFDPPSPLVHPEPSIRDMPANPARLERDLLRQERHEHRLMAPIVSLRELRQWGMGNNELRKIRDGGTIQGFLYLPQTGTVVLDAPADGEDDWSGHAAALICRPASVTQALLDRQPRVARLTADATRILNATIIQTYTPNRFPWESLVEPDLTDGWASP